MFVRLTSAVTAGSIITLGIFYVMQSLIALQPGAAVEDRTRGTLVFKPIDRETDVVPEQWKSPPKNYIEPPVTPRQEPETQNVTGIVIPAGPEPVAPPIDTKFTKGFGTDGPLVAMVRVEPTFPAAMATRGIEGWVIVQFDVTTLGTVVNTVVLDSSHSGFRNAALKAASKFRYKPRVVDGVPMPTAGIQTLFTFKLDEQ